MADLAFVRRTFLPDLLGPCPRREPEISPENPPGADAFARDRGGVRERSPAWLRRSLLTFICAGLTQSAFSQSEAASPDLTFRSDATEVRLTFSATDQNDRVIATVLPTDFAVVDKDLVVRKFRSFSRSEYRSVEVAVVLDASESVAAKFREELKDVLQVTGTNGVPDENFAVVSFRNQEPAVVCDGNCRALATQARFPVIASGGSTPLYDSLVFASHMLSRRTEPHGRKVLILFSDGADTMSLHSFADAIGLALDNDIAIYSVDVSPAPHVSRGTPVLRALSADTGGRYFSIEAGTGEILDAVLEDFRAAYTVIYKLPSRAAGFHQVRILSTHDVGLQFHCRTGYYYPSQSRN